MFVFKIQLAPPKITRAPSAAIQSKKGGSVRVECLATGNPTPNITWTRNNNVLPNGKTSIKTPYIHKQHIPIQLINAVSL